MLLIEAAAMSEVIISDETPVTKCVSISLSVSYLPLRIMQFIPIINLFVVVPHSITLGTTVTCSYV